MAERGTTANTSHQRESSFSSSFASPSSWFSSGFARRQPLIFRRRLQTVLLLTVYILFMVITWSYIRTAASQRHVTESVLRHAIISGSTIGTSSASSDRGAFNPAAVQILVPATKPSVNLCKLVVSSTLLGYAPPVLINWRREHAIEEERDGGPAISRITGVYDWLTSPTGGSRPHRSNELILVVDADDTWFQLPPEVLLSRYNTAVKSQTARTLEEFGLWAYIGARVRQGVIFAAQKNCGPISSHQHREVGCYAQPESNLPVDVYGPTTDRHDAETGLPLRMRPRWLSTAMMMGNAHSLRSLHERATSKMWTTNHTGRTEYIFADVFGEQQWERETARKAWMSAWRRSWWAFKRTFGLGPPSVHELRGGNERPNLLGAADGSQCHEFGIGLDYQMAVSQPMAYSEYDGQWLNYSEGEESLVAQQLGLGQSTPRTTGLPADLVYSRSEAEPGRVSKGVPGPFSALGSFESSNLSSSASSESTVASLARRSWADVPLYTNLFTGHVPVMLHMDGLEVMREHVWDRMWYVGETAHARTLLRAQQMRLSEDGDRRGRLGGWAERARGREFVDLREICAGSGEEVFRDGRGEWDG